MRFLVRFVPHAVVAIFAAWCAYALRGDLARISLAPVLRGWDVIALATVFSLVNYVLRIIRWRSYLARLGHPLGLRFAALSFIAGFAYTLSPGKVGEMVRARYYLPLGVPLSKTAAAFFAERVLDLLAMVVLAALLFAGSPQYRGAILGAAILVAGALVSFALVPWNRVTALLGASSRIPAVLRKALTGITSALAATKPLLRPVPLASGFAIAIVAWGLEGVGLNVLAGIIPGAHLDISTAVGVYAVAVLVGGLSFLPGGLGSTEAVMSALLVTHGFPIGDAILLTLACRLVTLWLAVCLGWVAVLALPKRSLAVSSSWP
jgi:glycosyltransferase 2 family protein